MNGKSIGAAVAAVVFMAAALSGCGGPVETAQGQERIELTWWTINHQAGLLSSYQEVEAFQTMQERSGIQIQFIHPAEGQATSQFNVMISSGDYPDIIDWNWDTEYPGGVNKAASDGVIIELNDYMPYAPNYSALLEQNPEMKKNVQTTDGAIMTFNSIKDDIKINSYFGPCIRKDWLDRLGLAVPQTIDEWHNVLQAFRSGDPNGNGKADEIPLTDDQERRLQYLSAAFGCLKGTFYEKQPGQMVYGSIQPEYKEFLQTMHDWYQEGLLDPEFASSSRTNTDAKVLDGTAGAFVGYSGSQIGNYLTENPESNIVGAPWPKGPAGISYIGAPQMLKTVQPGYGSAISTANRHIKETMAFLDWNYSEEGILRQNWGVEGETYQKTDQGYQFTDFVLHNPEGKSPIDVMSRYALTTTGGFGKIMNGDAYVNVMQTFEQQKEASRLWTQGDTSLLMPPYPLTAEESLRISAIMTEAQLYENEMYTKMIMGIEPISKFEEYVARMKEIGVEEAAALHGAAWARYQAQQ